MRRMLEDKLERVEVYVDGNTWSLQWGSFNFIFRGNAEDFAKFLMKIKAADDREDPKSYRSMKYLDIAKEILNGTDRVIWVFRSKLKTILEST